MGLLFVLNEPVYAGEVTSGQINAVPDSSYMSQEKIMNLYMEEWREVIQTQMHFNDLILRFRSFILAAIGAIFGVLIAWNATKKDQTNTKWLWTLGITLLAMWTSAFIMDYFYYFKMLLGSVEGAKKFDEIGREMTPHLFGLTATINEKVSVNTSKCAIILYYILPVIAVFVMLLVPKKWFDSK